MTKRNQKKRPSLRSKQGAWFVAVRGSYLPAGWQGWLTYIPFTAYLIFSLVVGWRQTSSTSLAVMFIVPNWIAAAAVMTWLAKAKS